MNVTTEATHWVRIFIAGELGTVKQICRSYCSQVGLCVTVEPTTYIYAWGEEAGAVVGLINYPRFPAPRSEIDAHADALARRLLDGCVQRSCTVMTLFGTKLISRGAVNRAMGLR